MIITYTELLTKSITDLMGNRNIFYVNYDGQDILVIGNTYTDALLNLYRFLENDNQKANGEQTLYYHRYGEQLHDVEEISKIDISKAVKIISGDQNVLIIYY